MFRSIVARLVSAFASDDEDGASEDESGFRRSRLDVSVLYAHGVDVGRLDREIADIEEQARETESVRRDR